MSHRKSQGSLEYLIMAAAVLAITSVVVLFLTGFFGGTQGSASFGACKQAAANCKNSKMVVPDDPCPQCDSACTGASGSSLGKDLLTNGTGCGGACSLCKIGQPARIASTPTPHEIEPDANTLGMWHFNEGAGITTADDSGNMNTGNTASIAWISSGKFGSAVNLTGLNRNISLGNSATLNTGDYFTFETWIKFTDFNGGEWSWIIYNRAPQTTNAGFHLIYVDPGKRLNYQYANGAIIVTKQSNVLIWNLGQWYHVAVTHDNIAKTIKFYQNGQSAGTVTYADNALPVNSGSAYLGGYQGDHRLNASLDDASISNRVKPAWEIWVDANA